MNDPGLDDAIANEASVLDQSSSGQPDKSIISNEKQDGPDADIPHAGRWWLASTAYPLAAVSRWQSIFSLLDYINTL